MPGLDAQTAQITNFILPWIGILISLIVAIWIKDFATSLAKGFKFQMNKAFNEGDKVLLEGNEAVIIKIGISETVFGVYSEKGYIWRYVPNERIVMLKLEKIINPDLHLDTDKEKAEKLQALIDTLQNKHINKNREEIENLKNDAKR